MVWRIIGTGVVLGLCLVVLFLLFWKLWFLRQPVRDIPHEGIVSPADGKVVRIIELNGTMQDVPKGLLGGVRTMTEDVASEGYLVVIMLSPLNVHYQRAPVSGTVVDVRYSKGKFRNAVSGAADFHAFENEKNEILIDTGTEKMKVVQVAGFAARRIVSYVEPGQKVKKGDVIGLINFGSQTFLVLPKKELLVSEGQRVVDGETVIAK